jgi:hypothetical protein
LSSTSQPEADAAAPTQPRRRAPRRPSPPEDGPPSADAPDNGGSARGRPENGGSAGRGSRPHHGAALAHATHGRVRLKLPQGKRHPELLAEIRAAFEGIPGIDAVDIRPDSGSVVIHYNPDHHPDIPSLFQTLSKTDAAPVVPRTLPPEHRPPKSKLDEEIDSITAEAEFLAEHSHLARGIVQYVKGLDSQIKRSTNNNVDLKILAPVGLAAFTFLEIGAAAATPMWVTLVIFSLNHFVELHAHDAGDAPRS